MNRWCVLIPVLALLPNVSAAECPPGGDQEKLRGRWTVIATEFDGQVMSADALKNREIEFEDGKFKVRVAGTLRRTLKFTLDESKQPKNIDIINPEKNETARGVYVF